MTKYALPYTTLLPFSNSLNLQFQAQILALQDQLRQRPPLDHVQALEREYKNLELLLSGTQRENERCMAELERAKSREKMLEKELARLAGENWQSSLGIPASNTSVGTIGGTSALGILGGPGPASSRSAFFRPGDASSFFLPQAESTNAIHEPSFDASNSGMSFLNNTNSPDANEAEGSGSPSTPKGVAAANAPNLSATLAHIAQVRTLILGMCVYIFASDILNIS